MLSKVNLILVSTLLGAAWTSAFVPGNSHRSPTSLRYAFHPDPASEIDRPLRRLTPDCVWVKETDEHRAVECAKGECSLEEIESLIKALKTSKRETPYDDEPQLSRGRDEVLKILELKQELKSLQVKLPSNPFANNAERSQDEQWDGHWFDDYLHHDEPRRFTHSHE